MAPQTKSKAVSAAGKKNNEATRVVEQAATLIKELDVKAKQLSHQDISKWRMAHQMALNVENPKRLQLYNIYDFTTAVDTHLTGVMQRTKQGVLQRRFKLVDAAGKEKPEATALLETPWFMKLLSLALDAEYYGHSLIQLGDVIQFNGKPALSGVTLVPRNHVCPEYGVILCDQNDEPGKGIPYREGPYARWTIEAGEPDSLGLFLKVTPHVISKKHVQIFWDNFAERFGIPLIYATTDTRNSSDRVKVEDMLKQMGNNAWAYFPVGTQLQLLETKGGDAFRVFDQRIIRANNEISIGLAGQTMSFSDGSSRSQAEVHERGFEEIKDSMANSLLFLCNYRLLPLLIMHGFPFQGLEFAWDDSYEYTPAEMREIERMLLQYYEVDPKYFVEEYNIPIKGPRNDGFFG